MVAEGYYATKSAHLLNEKNKNKTRLPIIEAVYSVLYEGKDAKKVFKKLTDKLD
jgi:glycerol-3-phosphate dehydrogenase (NAD(P)+)